MSGAETGVRWIGRSQRRVEDDRLLRGRGRFVEAVSPPGTAYIGFVRSPLGHARVVGIDTAEARSVPGVIGVLTAIDLGDVGAIPVNAVDGGDLVPIAPPLLAGDRVRFVGEPVAAVVADSRAGVEDAAELVRLDLDPLPVAATVEDALRADVVLHDEAPDNVLLRWRRRTDGVDAAFAAADRVVDARLAMPRLVAAPIEPRGAVASYDADTDLLTVWLSSQDPHRPLGHLSAVLRRPKGRIRIVVDDVGGAFGSKGTLATEAGVAAIAAMRFGRPIKWIEGRSENFLAAYQGRGFEATVSLAVRSDGRFLALRARLVSDLGAYLFPTTPAPPTTAAMLVTGAYAVPEVDVELLGVTTNRVPTGPYRGAGRPEGAYVAERMTDLAARELGIDPVAIRRRNLIAAEQMPYTTALGFTYDSGDYAAALDRVCELIGREEEETARDRAATSMSLSGVGLAVFIERAGAGLWESGACEVGPDGRVEVRTGSTPHGQGHETVFAQIAADVLGVDVSDVDVRAGDTSVVPEGMGTYASRSTTVGGSAVLVAARAVRDRAARLASRLLGVEPDAIRWRDGCAHGGGRAISLADLARAAHDPAHLEPGEPPGLGAETRFALSGPVFPYGAYAVAVRIDPDTGVVAVERVAAVDDAGRLVNPLLAEGQVVGSTVQGLGQALFEEMAADDEGQPLTANFTSYGLPGSLEVPPIASEFLETPSPLDPLGAKGIGESGSIAVPAAMANAVADALAPLGIRHLDPPYTPERVWRAIRGGSAPTSSS